MSVLHQIAYFQSKDIPQHAESILPAIDADHAASFIQILQACLPELTATQAARVRKVIQAVEKQR